MTKAQAIKTRSHKSIKKYPDVLTIVDLQQIFIDINQVRGDCG